ncbi:MAG: O-antigen ligase family protein [Planctomycetota bacterium]|jgi:hypothetical protein
MTNQSDNSGLPKTRVQAVLEYALLAVCLAVLALRTTFGEGPGARTTGQPLNLGDAVYSLSLSLALGLAFVTWLVWTICRRRFSYRFTAMEIGLCLFVAGAVLAGFAASNKRAAVTDFVTLLAPALMAVLLVQILDSPSKIKLTLSVVAALGVASAYECAFQLFVSNNALIAQYESEPGSILGPLGITPQSFARWQFEHRLYSKDIKGFFSTGNSAGSFALLAAFAALALVADTFRNRKSDTQGSGSLLFGGIAFAAIILGLAITHSKGAIAAALMAAAMLWVYVRFNSWLKTHKRIILTVCVLAIIAGGFVVIGYGISHSPLPGGNSMLVRWQYWRASARMYADHALTGVGGGNFVDFYPHYKDRAALETVSDPHNFILALLTQYGPLGLAGFLTMILIPMWRAVFSQSEYCQDRIWSMGPHDRKMAIVLPIVISLVLLIIRPMVMPALPREAAGVMIYAIFILYAAPVVTFALGFWLLMANEITPIRTGSHVTAILLCAIIGLLAHNLIDFAIFEPGVYTAFWVIAACMIASDLTRQARPRILPTPPRFAEVLVTLAALLSVWAYFSFALIPAVRTTAAIEQARQAFFYGSFEQAHELLDRAADDDPLEPAALEMNGRLYLQQYKEMRETELGLLEKAAACFLAAIERNEADFKNFELLTEAYLLHAERSNPQEKAAWLNKAFESATAAAELYGGCGRLRVELGRIAEQLDKTELAGHQYEEAVRIEDSYRRQFRLMYPGRPIFSRLGEEKYEFAKERMEALRKERSP